MKRLVLLLALLPTLTHSLPTVFVGTKITCIPPTHMTDGSLITDPITYKFYCKQGTQPYTILDFVSEEAICVKPLADITTQHGTHTCAVTANVNGTESGYSGDLNFTFNGQYLAGNGPVAPEARIE